MCKDLDVKITKDPEPSSNPLQTIVMCVKPFADAFEELCLQSYKQSDEDMIEFLDRNIITPTMTVGDFRRLYEAYKECT